MLKLKTKGFLFLVDELVRGTNEKKPVEVLQNILETFSKDSYFVNVTNFQEEFKIPKTYKCFGNPKFEFMGKISIKAGVFRDYCAWGLISQINSSDRLLREFHELTMKENRLKNLKLKGLNKLIYF